MAKTKPIGVRFDETILNMLKEKESVTSPQKALNFLERLYLLDGLTDSAKKEVQQIPIKELPKQVASQRPIRLQGEDSIDYAARVNEWKKTQLNQ